MEEARQVLARLARIEELDRAGASSDVLLAELRLLLSDAEQWARREGGEAGADAVAKLRAALARELIAV
jgi:hypothetical protein